MPPLAEIASAPIDTAALLEQVAAPGNGATVLFTGTVRNSNRGRSVDYLEYQLYEKMAGHELGRIVAAAEKRWPAVAVAAVHRVGRLEVGEVSVAVAAGSPHRAEAFEVCRYVVEELKSRLPVWKQEGYTGGSREWVPGVSPATTAP
ncbi:MAG: molybdenum cofactor biosynthesis protein MoaE [Longimicrobiaceae bacterium]